MNDSFYEQLVARKSRPIDMVIRILTILALILLAFVGFIFLGFLIIPVIILLGFLVYAFVLPRLKVEYEYALLNHDMQIDVIYNKEKRKSLLSFNLRDAEIMAPKDSPELTSYHADKVLNFTSLNSSAKIFEMYILINQKKYKLLLEPDLRMQEHMKTWMGRKFISE